MGGTAVNFRYILALAMKGFLSFGCILLSFFAARLGFDISLERAWTFPSPPSKMDMPTDVDLLGPGT